MVVVVSTTASVVVVEASVAGLPEQPASRVGEQAGEGDQGEAAAPAPGRAVHQ